MVSKSRNEAGVLESKNTDNLLILARVSYRFTLQRSKLSQPNLVNIYNRLLPTASAHQGSLSVSPVISVSATACLLPDVDPASTPSQHLTQKLIVKEVANPAGVFFMSSEKG